MAQIDAATCMQVAQGFVQFYYPTFDSNRAGLAPLYREQSMLSFEGQKVVGGAEIVQKLAALPFQSVAHRVTSLDAQASGAGPRGVVVVVTGDIQINGAEPQKFTQSFHLVPNDANGQSYWVHNDIFRLG